MRLVVPSATASSEPSPGHRRAAALAAAILSLIGLVAAPFASTPLPVLPGLLPIVVGAALAAHLVTAALLFGQAYVLNRGGPAYLGAAYLFSAAIAVPYILTLPGVAASVPAEIAWSGSWANAAWLWTVGQVGFAALVAWYARRSTRDGTPPLRGIVIAVLAAAVALALLLPGAKALVEGAGLGWLASALAELGVTLSSVAALVLLARRSPWGSLVDLWLGVALLAAVIDGALTVLGGERFSLGWYIGRGVSVLGVMVVLQAVLFEITALYHSAAVLAEADALTNLANRRRFDRVLAQEWLRAQREQTPIALVIIDVDYFKRFNDRYGHPAGDLCLREIAALLTAAARRPADLAARLGGEEFALLLPGTDEAGAAHIAWGLRAALIARGIPHADGLGGGVTLSAGVADRRPAPTDFDSAALIDAADRALYRAKSEGRDRVAVDRQDGPTDPGSAQPGHSSGLMA